MHFFRKSNKNDKDNEVLNPSPNAQESTGSNTPENPAGTDAAPMSHVEMERRIREEAKRLRTTEHLLSAPHLQRIQDTLRLNETKLQNIEENLQRTREQKDRLRRYKELSGELELQRAHLYEVHKQASGMLGDKQELDRFETFENIQGRFQRLQVLERQRREEKQRETALAANKEVLQRELDEADKELERCMDEARESEMHLKIGQTAVNNALMLEGSNNAYRYTQQRANEYANQLNSKCQALEKELQEMDLSMGLLKDKIEKERTRLQSTEAHQRMTEHGELVVAYLTRLQDLKLKSEKVDTSMKEAERRQRSENDMLGRVFADYQQVEAQIKTLDDELHVHRQNILGQDSYRLQERAMHLKRRRQMLKSAQALWRRISKLYDQLEQKQQDINALRLHQEHSQDNVRQMEIEVGILRRSYREKEYTFTLSKSQNVIQLRGDLQEGVSCTVCGAKHHPYHSDTMLEQNKLIGEIKTEVELLQAELRNKENELMDMRLDLAQVTTAKNRAEDELITLRELQNEAVNDWAMYAELDPTFNSCDSSTNAEARTAILRQLIENIETDVKKAQDELDTYNFHQVRINELTEQSSIHAQTRSDLTTRMNELNTSCQVLAREVDRLSERKQELASAYGRQFETLEKLVTIPDWHNSWRQSHEGLIMRIQELTTERNSLGEKVRQDETELNLLSNTRSQLKERLNELMTHLQHTRNSISDFKTRQEENNKELERLLGGDNSKHFNETLTQAYLQSRQHMERQQNHTIQKRETFLQLKGREEELHETMLGTDAMAATERSALDVWIRQYNASHSPVQYTELEQFFGQDRDWTRVREEIRSTDMEAKLTQAKVDQLRSQMVALQAEGNIPDGDVTDALLALAKQEEVLEKRRRDAMLQIATNTITLQAHEKAETLIKDEKMKENTLNRNI